MVNYCEGEKNASCRPQHTGRCFSPAQEATIHPLLQTIPCSFWTVALGTLTKKAELPTEHLLSQGVTAMTVGFPVHILALWTASTCTYMEPSGAQEGTGSIWRQAHHRIQCCRVSLPIYYESMDTTWTKTVSWPDAARVHFMLCSTFALGNLKPSKTPVHLFQLD